MDAVTVLTCFGSPQLAFMTSFSTISLPISNALLHLHTLTFDSVFSPYHLFNRFLKVYNLLSSGI
jgi:hypothetical protein